LSELPWAPALAHWAASCSVRRSESMCWFTRRL